MSLNMSSLKGRKKRRRRRETGFFHSHRSLQSRAAPSHSTTQDASQYVRRSRNVPDGSRLFAVSLPSSPRCGPLPSSALASARTPPSAAHTTARPAAAVRRDAPASLRHLSRRGAGGRLPGARARRAAAADRPAARGLLSCQRAPLRARACSCVPVLALRPECRRSARPAFAAAASPWQPCRAARSPPSSRLGRNGRPPRRQPRTRQDSL